jgi:hypothetical protein
VVVGAVVVDVGLTVVVVVVPVLVGATVVVVPVEVGAVVVVVALLQPTISRLTTNSTTRQVNNNLFIVLPPNIFGIQYFRILV